MEVYDFYGWVKVGNIQEVKNRLKLHPGWLDLPNDHGWTPLHLAVRSSFGRKHQMIQFLLNAGPRSIDSRDHDGLTPFHLAVRHGYTSIAYLLMRANPRTGNIPDNYGFTPLHTAVQSGYAEIVAFLLRSECVDINSLTLGNETPLDLGITYPQWKAVQLLRSVGVQLACSSFLGSFLKPLTEDEILEGRFAIYFSSSLFLMLVDLI